MGNTKSKNQTSKKIQKPKLKLGFGSWDFLWILDLGFRFFPLNTNEGRRPERTHTWVRIPNFFGSLLKF